MRHLRRLLHRIGDVSHVIDGIVDVSLALYSGFRTVPDSWSEMWFVLASLGCLHWKVSTRPRTSLTMPHGHRSPKMGQITEQIRANVLNPMVRPSTGALSEGLSPERACPLGSGLRPVYEEAQRLDQQIQGQILEPSVSGGFLRVSPDRGPRLTTSPRKRLRRERDVKRNGDNCTQALPRRESSGSVPSRTPTPSGRDRPSVKRWEAGGVGRPSIHPFASRQPDSRA